MSRSALRAAAFGPALISLSACGSGPSEVIGPPPSPALTLTLTVSPSQVEIPASVEAQVIIGNAEFCTASFAGSIPPRSGTFTVVVSQAGNHEFTITCKGLDGSMKTVSVTVIATRPRVSGRIFCPTLENCITDARVYIMKGAVRDSTIDLNPDGSFVIETSLKREDGVDAILGSKNLAASRYYPSLVAIRKEWYNGSLTLVRVPRERQIGFGIFAGQMFSLDLERGAYSHSASDGGAFYLKSTLGSITRYSIASIPGNRYPVPLAFDRGGSNITLDSIGLWRAIDNMEIRHGRDLFRPANFLDLPDGEGIRVQGDNTRSRSSAGATSNAVGDIVGCRLTFNQTAAMSHAWLVEHELGHCMGFGHTCSWQTVMFTGCTNALSSEVWTASDIAYREFYEAVQETYRRTGAKFGLPEAHQGQRVLELGLPRETIWYPPN